MTDSESEREREIRTEDYNNEINAKYDELMRQYPDMPKEIGEGSQQLSLRAAVMDKENQKRITAATLRNPLTVAICRYKTGPIPSEQTELAKQLPKNPVLDIGTLSQLIEANHIVIRPTPYLPAELIHLFVKLGQVVQIRIEVKKSIWFYTSRKINLPGTPLHK